MILVDTSLWVEHLRRRIEVLDQLGELPVARVGRHEDALAAVRQRPLFGRGIGWMDVPTH